jgi:1,4-dihydroxy-2-naphthoyl-CoA synthase
LRAYAQRKGQRIDQEKHLVLKALYPSPLAANRGGFFGCKVFSKSNNYLKQHGIEPIDWQLDMTYSPFLKLSDLIVEEAKNGWRIVRLNRPKSLHALDETIVSALFEVFQDFHSDDAVKAIWLDSTTPKAFCAGGDVRKLHQLVINDEVETANQFFEQEYALDLLLHNYAKPVLVWGEGYVMGGGLGLFMAAPFRLVTPHSRLAMPEINIGLYQMWAQRVSWRIVEQLVCSRA